MSIKFHSKDFTKSGPKCNPHLLQTIIIYILRRDLIAVPHKSQCLDAKECHFRGRWTDINPFKTGLLSFRGFFNKSALRHGHLKLVNTDDGPLLIRVRLSARSLARKCIEFLGFYLLAFRRFMCWNFYVYFQRVLTVIVWSFKGLVAASFRCLFVGNFWFLFARFDVYLLEYSMLNCRKFYVFFWNFPMLICWSFQCLIAVILNVSLLEYSNVYLLEFTMFDCWNFRCIIASIFQCFFAGAFHIDLLELFYVYLLKFFDVYLLQFSVLYFFNFLCFLL